MMKEKEGLNKMDEISFKKEGESRTHRIVVSRTLFNAMIKHFNDEYNSQGIGVTHKRIDFL